MFVSSEIFSSEFLFRPSESFASVRPNERTNERTTERTFLGDYNWRTTIILNEVRYVFGLATTNLEGNSVLEINPGPKKYVPYYVRTYVRTYVRSYVRTYLRTYVRA